MPVTKIKGGRIKSGSTLSGAGSYGPGAERAKIPGAEGAKQNQPS